MEMGTPAAHSGILHLKVVFCIAHLATIIAEIDVPLVVIIVFGFIVVSSRFFVVSSLANRRSAYVAAGYALVVKNTIVM